MAVLPEAHGLEAMVVLAVALVPLPLTRATDTTAKLAVLTELLAEALILTLAGMVRGLSRKLLASRPAMLTELAAVVQHTSMKLLAHPVAVELLAAAVVHTATLISTTTLSPNQAVYLVRLTPVVVEAEDSRIPALVRAVLESL